jgi:hypothetical protein
MKANEGHMKYLKESEPKEVPYKKAETKVFPKALRVGEIRGDGDQVRGQKSD